MFIREFKKYRVYTPFGDNKMYLTNINGEEMIAEAVDRFQAFCAVWQWILDNSNYSQELTEKWLNDHPLCFAQVQDSELDLISEKFFIKTLDIIPAECYNINMEARKTS